MYDPVTARFLQEDTYKGDPNDPLSLNLYTYGINNPSKYFDPTGHFVVTLVLAVLVGATVGALALGGSEYYIQSENESKAVIKKDGKLVAKGFQPDYIDIATKTVDGAILGTIGAASVTILDSYTEYSPSGKGLHIFVKV